MAFSVKLPSSDGPSFDSIANPAPVNADSMRLAVFGAAAPTASDADAGPSRVSVATASGGSGNDGGSASQIRPHSVSVWVGGDATATGEAAVDPPGTGVSSAVGVAVAAAD